MGVMHMEVDKLADMMVDMDVDKVAEKVADMVMKILFRTIKLSGSSWWKTFIYQ